MLDHTIGDTYGTGAVRRKGAPECCILQAKRFHSRPATGQAVRWASSAFWSADAISPAIPWSIRFLACSQSMLASSSTEALAQKRPGLSQAGVNRGGGYPELARQIAIGHL